MDGSIRIGRIFGIPILIHYTFLLVIPLFAWIIGSQITLTIDMLREIYQVPIDTTLATAGYMPYVLGTIVALGLFFGDLHRYQYASQSQLPYVQDGAKPSHQPISLQLLKPAYYLIFTQTKLHS